RLAKGCITYSRLLSQVLPGEGRLEAQVALEMDQSDTTMPMPTSGRISQSSLNFFMRLLGVESPGSTLQVFNREAGGVGFGVGRIEGDAVEERLRRVVGAAVRVADFLHGFLVEIGAHDAFRDT